MPDAFSFAWISLVAASVPRQYQRPRSFRMPRGKLLSLPDFSRASQDVIALQLINECHALPLIDAGRFDEAVMARSSRWASLPGNKDGQHQHQHQHQQSLDWLRGAFLAAGGYIA
ncbi:MAG: hypothetical protein V4505_22040 [Pseudomonadota bacterium]